MFRPLYKDSTRDPYTGDWHTVFGLIHLVPDEFIKYDRRVVVRAKYDQTDQGPMGQFTVLLLQNIPGTRRMRVALKLEMKNIDMSAALAERRRF
jgi:hypothetical protein